jgi:hypothetical protein
LSQQEINKERDIMKHLTALFYDASDASRTLDALLDAGVKREDISLLTSEAGAQSHLSIKEGDKSAEGATTGGIVGGALGLIAGTLVTAATAGVGILATGPILVGLAGLGTGAVLGGIAGALSGMGVPEHEAKFYEREIKERNAILIGARVDERDEDAMRDLMQRYNPAKVNAHA